MAWKPPPYSQDGGQHSSLCGPEDKDKISENPHTLDHVANRENKENSTATEPLRFQNSLLTQTTHTEQEQNKPMEEQIFVQNESMLPGL